MGFPCMDIGTDQIKEALVFFKGFSVKKIQFVRQFMITEVCSEKVSCFPPGAPRTVAGIPAETFVVTQGSAGLTGFVIASESGAGGNSGNGIKLDFFFHEKIKYACGKESPHGAPFKNEAP